MEMFNTEFTVKFTESDRQEPDILTDLCCGNILHLGGAPFRTVSLFIVIIHYVETMKTVTGNSIT